MADHLAELRAVFGEALERPTPAERVAYLDHACRGKPEFRARVEELLRAQQEAGSFLQEPAGSAADTAGDSTAPPDLLGTAVGPYRLLELIGEGGFGMVFEAEQQAPVRRQVALKVLKPGMDTRQVVARFEAERQALALMDHPHIARVFDTGTSASGQPYFVMELVRGHRITDHCDQDRLALPERLGLFVDVCQAVQHAHHKGVIHRDIKPSNVLVTAQDGKAAVKVIDFGIAKALGQRLTDKTVFTSLAQMVGTPLYMSPEQAGLGGLDVDTRSDIYGLGVLLYELLTGTTPFDRARLSGMDYDEMRRVIREEDPPKPSTRVAALGPAAATVSARRQSDPRRLSQLCRGELDWIVMKAMEKDRGRRYESAGALAADVQRYLRDEPVAAGPPSAWYRLRKFTRRHRGALATAAVVVAALAVTGGGAWWSERRQAALASAEKAQAEALDNEVNRAADEAGALLERGSWPEAQAAVERCEKLLAAAGRTDLPERLREQRRDLAMVRRLGEIDNRIDNLAVSSPEQDAAYAQAFREDRIDMDALSDDEAAERVRARRIRRELARALDAWARARRRAKGGATADWRRLLTVATAADPDPWRSGLRSALKAGDRKRLEAVAADADIRRLPPATLYMLATGLDELGATKQAGALLRTAQGQYPGDWWLSDALGRWCFNARPPLYGDAVRYFTAAAATRPQSPYTAEYLATALLRRGSAAEAVAEFSRALELKSDLREALVGRGDAYQRLGEWDRARADFTRAAEPEPASARAWYNRGLAYGHLGQWDQALAAYSRAIALDATFVGAWGARGEAHIGLHRWRESLADCSRAIELDPQFTLAWCKRGIALAHLGQGDRALADCSRAIELEPQLAVAWEDRGEVHAILGWWDEARADCGRAVELDPRRATAWAGRGQAAASLGQWDKAIDECSRAIALDPRLATAWSNRGAAYLRLRKPDRALADCSRAVELDPKFVMALSNRATAYAHLGKWEPALADLSRAVELSPTFTEGWFNRATAYATLGKWEPALADFSKVVELAPGDAAAWGGRGTANAHLGRWDRAAADYSRAAGLAPKEKAYRSALGEAHYRGGDYQAAVAALTKATELDRGGDTTDWLFLAMAHWKLGNKAPAREWHDRAARRIDKDQSKDENLKALRAEAEGLMARSK